MRTLFILIQIFISGIYPELAFYNNEAECGTGALAPWAGRLWAVTYAPHSPYGSSDKLYEISGEMELAVRPESIGGTPADRMIHPESGQLMIGPYLIDSLRNVRTISCRTAPGRYTAAARHLYRPDSLLYVGTMEEGFYEVDVNTLTTNTLWSDDNAYRRPAGFPVLAENLVKLPGWHGKGMYSGQGVLVYANNGEYGQRALEHFDAVSGALCEWNGDSWKVIRRNQFTDVTGPDGIGENGFNSNNPIWTIGFDYKSLLLGVRDNGGWTFYRLPKASYSYDGAHGWNTEWPRIRNIGEGKPDYLMTMHGMFWRFPGTFTSRNSGGIRPRSAYLKVVGDFTRWNGRLVMGCDDSAQNEFLNKRNAKGAIDGPGQSNSNLWFMPLEGPDTFGPNDAGGYVWLREKLQDGAVSEPFLFAGWKHRRCWIRNSGDSDVCLFFETDRKGTGRWRVCRRIVIKAGSSATFNFKSSLRAEWIRVRLAGDGELSVGMVYSNGDFRSVEADHIFDGIARIGDESVFRAVLYSLGKNRRKLGVLSENGRYFEADSKMSLKETSDSATARYMKERFAFNHKGVEVFDNSVLVVDNSGRRWRLPVGDMRYKSLVNEHKVRICREVATERDLFNCCGTFYELPAENADGFAKIRPIASHSLMISDYASYRGLLIMSGVKESAAVSSPHVFSCDGMSVWAGAIDDLWKLGRPVGHGGPWYEDSVSSGDVSDPFLFGYFSNRELRISHNAAHSVDFTVEFDPTGDGEWMEWKTVAVREGEEYRYKFGKDFNARWIRFRVGDDCRATTVLEYK